ncbi:hypothetical protein ABIB48_000986 [Arthrobacter sp. UYCu511]
MTHRKFAGVTCGDFVVPNRSSKKMIPIPLSDTGIPVSESGIGIISRKNLQGVVANQANGAAINTLGALRVIRT